MMAARKRDRWDSSDEEEEGRGTAEVLPVAERSVASIAAEASSIGQQHLALPASPISAPAPAPNRIPLVSRKHNPLLQGCRSVYSCYERLARLDEGTYGVVWKARDTATDEVVALKQIKFDSSLTKEGFPIAALREISVLLDLSHECIVTVREMVVGDDADKVFMVMEVSVSFRPFKLALMNSFLKMRLALSLVVSVFFFQNSTWKWT